MHKFILFVFLGFAVFSFGQKYEKIQNPTECKKKLEAHFRSTKTLKCDFTEKIKNPVFEEKVENKGEMAFDKNGKIRWEVLSTKSILLINKEGIRMSKDGKEITNPQANRMAKRMQTFLYDLMSGNFLDEKKFTIYFYESANTYRLNLVPKNSRLKKYISKIKLTFDKKTLLLSRMKIIQGEGNSIEYFFQNIQKNVSLSASTFTKF